MSRKLIWTHEAWKSCLYWQSQDRKTLKRINKLIEVAIRKPFEGIGKPEGLKENLSGPAVLMMSTVWFMQLVT